MPRNSRSRILYRREGKARMNRREVLRWDALKELERELHRQRRANVTRGQREPRPRVTNLGRHWRTNGGDR